MKQLKFYIKQIDPNLLKSISGRPGQLIELIKTGEYLNEESLAKQLFDGEWSHQNYLNIKSRTKQILNAFFLISPPKKNNKTLKKIRECRKDYLLGISFIEYFKREAAGKLLLNAFNTAMEYGLTRLAYDSAIELMTGASLERRKNQFDFYRTKVEELEKDMIAERKAQQYYYDTALQMGSKRGLNLNHLNQHIEELTTFACTSIKFIEYYYTICILRDWTEADYHTAKQSTKAALNILLNKKGVYRSTLHFFTQTQAVAHIALREYDEAEVLLKTAEDYAPPRSFNFAVLQYYQAINALHSGDYQTAHDLYRACRKNRFDILTEQWAILGAYLYFLHQTGRLKAEYTRFSVGKYLNETAETAHDKTGSNVNILIGELLLYLVKDRSRFINRVESVNNYSYRHLKGRDTQRARWFIRLLCMIPRADFNFIKLQRIAKKQITNLEQFPIHTGDNLSIEIIPFGDLLKMIDFALKQKVA